MCARLIATRYAILFRFKLQIYGHNAIRRVIAMKQERLEQIAENVRKQSERYGFPVVPKTKKSKKKPAGKKS